MERQHILVIEDDPSVCELLASCLGGPKYRVSTARNGEDGLRLIEDHQPHLVILDLVLPGMNGLDVCRAMRRDPWMEKIPVLMLTGRDEEEDMIAGLEVGADDYMTKPFATKVLAARVSALLRRRTAADPDQLLGGELLEVKCLGRCELRLGDRTIGWVEKFSPSQRMLLAELVAAPDGRIAPEDVQRHFWPDTTTARRRSNFDSLMTRLRKTLEQELPGMEVRRHLLLRRGIICLEHVRVDAHEFRRLAGKGLRAAVTGELWQAELAFSAAFSLWQGAFLPGDFGSEAAAAYRDELERLNLEASRKFAQILAHGGRLEEAAKLLRYALRHNPADEGSIRLLHRLELAQHHPTQARQLLDQYSELLTRKQFPAEEVRRIVGSFPQELPEGGWLTA